MKRVLLLVIVLLATICLGQGAQNPPAKIVDVVFVVPNGFKGPIFVDQHRVVLPDVIARQKNTYLTVVVDEGGEAVEIGDYDLVPGWTYPYTVVQRNGLAIKGGDAAAADGIGFHVIGGFGPWQRAYRPGGFGAYFIGTKAQADAFRVELQKLVDMPVLPGH